MRLASDTRSGDGVIYRARNLVVSDPVNGGPLVRRASFAKLTASAAFGPGSPALQAVGTLEQASPVIVAIVGGEIWTTSASATTFTKQVSRADFTTAGVTFSTTADVFFVTFLGKLVLTDNTNPPFTWDGTAGAGGLSVLTNAPSKTWQAPTVYYGKLFFIKDVAANGADRSTIVWSEENQPNVGYETGGYNDVWTLSQSGAGSINAIVGLNDGLYYFRRNAIGVIRGSANSTFVAAGVHDSVAGNVGAVTSRAVTFVGNSLYFADALGRPFALPAGGPPLPLWRDLLDVFGMYQEVSGFGSQIIAIATRVFPVPSYDAVAFSYSVTTGSGIGVPGYLYNDTYVFSVVTNHAISHWTLPTTAGLLPASVFNDALGHSVLACFVPSGGGYDFYLCPRTATVYADESGLSVNYVAETVPLGVGAATQTWNVDEVSADILVGPNGGSAGSMNVAMTMTASGPPDFGVYATVLGTPAVTSDSVTAVAQRRVTVGAKVQARWFQVSVAPGAGASTAFPFAVERIVVKAHPQPTVPQQT